ncbi:hypothetical protein KFL_005950035 [Klebsormidium nitens]|uniref:Uncharacterized protein n=1 Tax=Klebsormidium nitens TaxID=105231 RepID=A0A1Y1IMT1_KLENI|nr:hypothetical protein KFL_005950035 [Klebsormidium nitens]|eukprot:GAQ90066.1 hypothetical protein KFL_005950035 [Klebsormidium nitens]
MERSVARLQSEVAALKRDLEQARGQAPGASAKKTIADLHRSIDGIKQKLAQAEREKAEIADQVYKLMGETAAEQRRLHKEAMAEAARTAAQTAAKLNTDLEFAKAKMRSLTKSQEILEEENVRLTVAMSHSGSAQKWLAQDQRIRDRRRWIKCSKRKQRGPKKYKAHPRPPRQQ